MKYTLFTLLVFFQALNNSFGQSGCTDPQATNYDPNATVNDGSCVYPATSTTAVLKTNIASSPETSGLKWSSNGLWTHDDSGGPATIYQIDTTTGTTLKSVIIDNYPNIDWEDIDADNNFIYIAETGNNNGNRTDLKILKVAKADIVSDATVHVNATAINFSYADQTDFTPSTTHNFDCEAITIVGDSIYLFTKNWGDQNTKQYILPKTPGTYSVQPHSSYNVGCLITGADYSATKNEITLLGYSSSLPPTSVLWILNDYKVDSVFTGNKRKISLNYPSIWQTEGIAYLTDSEYFLSSEAVTQLSLPARLFKINNTWTPVTNLVDKKKMDVTIFPNPATDKLTIKGSISGLSYRIADIYGKVISSEITITSSEETIDLSNISSGTYVIDFLDKEQNVYSEKIIVE